MAPAIRAIGVQIALPAPRPGCLADDRVLQLSGLQLYRVPVSSLRRQGNQLHPTCRMGRGRNPAVADNHGCEGVAAGRSIRMICQSYAKNSAGEFTCIVQLGQNP